MRSSSSATSRCVTSAQPLGRVRRLTSRVRGDRRGVAAIEFAILGPLLLVMIAGILVYGDYFMLAHSVQQLANDAARATVAGMTDSERQTLASNCLNAELPSFGLAPASVQLGYSDPAGVATVSLSYDSSSSPIWSLKGLLPMPPAMIVRSAAIQLGGY